jgi:hypothetical protein
MSETSARLRISMKDGEFELAGSELFVTQQIENFKELIVESLKKNPLDFNNQNETQSSGLLIAEGVINNDNKNIPPAGELSASSFERVFHVDNGQIKIIKKAPGSNDAKKTVNVALIYLWAKETVGIASVSFSEIRDLCQEQGCLDSGNFSKVINRKREWIIVEGSGQSQTCKLTLPGREEALKIIRELNKA